MRTILAIDAGGTSTRAAIVDESGRCLGYGQTGGGNPVSAGSGPALTSLVAAAREALETSLPTRDHPAADGPSSALIAMAGASAQTSTVPIAQRLAEIGLHGSVAVESDLLAMFRSGTVASNGYALVAGTGAVAARLKDDRLAVVSDGAGWLLGDVGSGYWIGHHVVRAVVAALDGREPRTELTALVLAAMKLQETPERSAGRPLVLLELMHALYAMRPVELARFAPLAFQARGDRIAQEILAAAADGLITTLASVRGADPVGQARGQATEPATIGWRTDSGRPIGLDGPVVLGGSILGSALLAEATPFAETMMAGLAGSELIHVQDGVVGAAALGLTRADVRVDAELLARIDQSVARWRTPEPPKGART